MTDKQQTALQELKENIKIIIGNITGDLNLYTSGYKQCLINVLDDIEAKLPMEQKQIEEAYNQGIEAAIQFHYGDGQQYFTDTYQNKSRE